MIIRGTEKIKGALDLAAIGIQLNKGETRSIPHSDFWRTDVQRALRAGFIVSEKESEIYDNSNEEEDLPIECVNSYHRPLNILKRQDQVRAGSQFTLTRPEFNTPEIQAALAKGMISVVSTGIDNDISTHKIEETTISVSKIIEKHEQQLMNNERESQKETQSKRRVLDLDTNEELSTPTVVFHQPSSTKQEEDKRKKTVVWNPTGAKEGNTMKRAIVATGTKKIQIETETGEITEIAENVIDTDNPPPVNSNEGDVSRQAVVIKPQDKEVEFVDEKAKKDRKDAHPILKDKPDVIEDDVSFLNPDEERRQKHPVLKSKKEEDDFFI